ncbi:MAG TPA: hypothetical protein VGD42_10190 [Lysobacter sp.]
MDAPRYFVTYRRLDGGEPTTRVFGRFPDRTLAERIARMQFGLPGYEVLDVRPETHVEAVNHRVSRFITRTLRIALGTSLFLLAYHALFRTGPRVADVPLSRLTLHMLLTFGFHGLLLLGAVFFCWDIAFGEGPQRWR